MSINPSKQLESTLLGYDLTLRQNTYVNYLIPSITSFLLYAVLIACDLGVVYRHYYDENPIWASLGIFFLYLPVLGCYVVTISSLDLWPHPEGCGRENIKWFFLKTLQHLFFPLWTTWRYAERIFWSIEAYRAQEEDDFCFATSIVRAPRSVELYLFLQGFLQAVPQIFLQLHVLMTKSTDIAKETVDAQVASLVFNLVKMAATTAFYQRFKSQKMAGKTYPWYKSYRTPQEPGEDEVDEVKVRLRHPHATESAPPTPRIISLVGSQIDHEPDPSQSRRSSDFYMEPSTPFDEPEDDRDAWEILQLDSSEQQDITEPDFNIRRLIYIRALPEDDLVGKVVAFFWWFCFLIARMLALASFAYFYRMNVLWIVLVHFVIVEAFLIYDVKSDEVKRAKAIFFLFLGFIYLFVIIEFKIKFKKTKFIYYGYFTLVFVENFTMCLIWWFSDLELMENDFWFRYVFCVITLGSIMSLTSMLFYLNVNKPEKVVVDTRVL